jgi:4-amino-4-deoxy-L-arabinose transferase-like glycosyltransferase
MAESIVKSPGRTRVALPRRAGPTLLVVGALALAAYLVGNDRVSLWDRDEPRYAQCAREMLRSGDWVVPRLYGEPRTAKPPLIYWLQASAMKVLGETAAAARLPSAVAMPITLALFYFAVRAAAGRRRAFWSTLVLASCVMVLISAKAGITDSVLLLWTTVAQVCLYLLWRGHRSWAVVVVMALALGLAGLTKGPVVLGVLGMTALLLFLIGRTIPAARRRAAARDAGGSGGGWLTAALQFLVAVAIVAAIVGPWIYLVQQRSPGFVTSSVSHDVLKRMSTGLEGHKGPPGYHLGTVWAFFLPWSLLLPLAVALGWKNRHLPPVRFALAAVVGPWLMFELVKTKLPHYMLPTYPALAFLVGDAIVRCLRGQHLDLVSRPFVVAVGVWAAIMGVAAVVPLGASVYFKESPLPALPFAVAGLCYVSLVFLLFLRRRTAAGLIAMGVGSIAVCIIAWGVYLPAAQYLRTSIRVADILEQNGGAAPARVLMLDYKEPSLAFYQGGAARENRAGNLTPDLIASAPWLVVTGEVWDRADEATRARVEVVGQARGLAYADGGRVVDLFVLRSRDYPGDGPAVAGTRD